MKVTGVVHHSRAQTPAASTSWDRRLASAFTASTPQNDPLGAAVRRELSTASTRKLRRDRHGARAIGDDESADQSNSKILV